MKTRYKALVFILCLLPFVLLVFDIVSDRLSANPVEDITHRSGEWALNFLIITLSITPLRSTFGWQGLLRLRRMLGLYSFFYALVHFSIYLLDQSLSVSEIINDIVKRPYITVGFSALILMLPLALTSNRFSIKRLGRQWKHLHQLIYIIAVAAILHYLWLVKADILEPVVYALLVIMLLGWRAILARRASELSS